MALIVSVERGFALAKAIYNGRANKGTNGTGNLQQVMGDVRDGLARVETRLETHDREIERLRADMGTMMSRMAARTQEIVSPVQGRLDHLEHRVDAALLGRKRP